MTATKNALGLLWLFVLVMIAGGCSSVPHDPSPPVVPPPVIPLLSPELSVVPIPSGSYWDSVTKWRQTWDEALKTLRLKSEASNAPTSR